MRYLPLTDADRSAMLSVIGAGSIDDLFIDVPAEARLDGPIRDLPMHASELSVERHMTALARKNLAAGDAPFFLGCGAYRHHVPASVDHLIQRGEFLTAYTPYQPEASQGTLQATFEYQTLITQLTGMDVSNASLYDGGSAVTEAVLMAIAVTRRFGRVVVAGTIHPEHRRILATYLEHLDPEVVTVPTLDGKVDARAVAGAITPDTAAVVIQQPNFFGELEDVDAVAKAAHDQGATLIASVDPISLGLLRRPDAYGADVVVAEGQGLGNPM